MRKTRKVHVQSHYRNGHFVRSHNRIMYVGGDKPFKKTARIIGNDSEVYAMRPNINIREVSNVYSETGDIVGNMTPATKGTHIIGVNVLIDKHIVPQHKGFAILHEIGHIDDKIKHGFGIPDEEHADRFAIRKAKDLGIQIPKGLSVDTVSRGEGVSKWQRKIMTKRGDIVKTEGPVTIPW